MKMIHMNEMEQKEIKRKTICYLNQLWRESIPSWNDFSKW